jgi:hypothetical protein
MSVFANNKSLAMGLLKKAGSGENLLKVLDMIAEDVKQDEKQSA